MKEIFVALEENRIKESHCTLYTPETKEKINKNLKFIKLNLINALKAKTSEKNLEKGGIDTEDINPNNLKPASTGKINISPCIKTI